jgi:membrane protein
MANQFNDPLEKQAEKDISSPNKFLFWFKRVFYILQNSVKGYIEDDCYTKASALTYYSLLSVVPVLAVLFGIAKGFGFQQALESEIKEKLSEQPEVAHKLIEFAYSWLQSVQGGVIVGVGTLLLFWTVIGLLNNVEAALNAIWKTKVSRSYLHKITDYLGALIIAPLFLVTSSGINIFLNTQLSNPSQNILFEAVNPFLFLILKLFPYFLTWILFTFVYLFMPNTKVYIRSAMIAAILAGSSFQIWQWIYINFQIGVASYGGIYGSFAALPLFLIWLQVSWLILLAGAEVTVQLQNDFFTPNRQRTPESIKTLALLITYRCIEAFVTGKKAPTDGDLAQELGVSLNHIHSILGALRQANLLSEVSLPNRNFGYQPGRSVESITMKSVMDAMEKNNEVLACVNDSAELRKIQGYLNEVEGLIAQENINKPLFFR